MEILTVILGLVIGSFLSVCIFRIPYGREKGPPDWEEEDVQAEDSGAEPMSIMKPARSFCPSCKATLRWYHNIPLFSWLALRGKCAFCGSPIPFRYPLIELLSAAACLMSYLWFGPSWTALVIYALCCALIVISFIDMDYYIIPDVISIPGMVVGLLVGLINEFTSALAWPVNAGILQSVVGLVFGAGILLLVSEVYRRLRKRIGLGLGDVKFLGMVGSLLGIEGAFYTMFIGSLFGAIIGLSLIAFFKKSVTHQLPFGPYLALGTVVYVFVSHVGPAGIPILF